LSREVGPRSTARKALQVLAQTAIRIAEMLMGMLYGWWRTQQEIRSVKREEALAYADHSVDVLFEGRAAWVQPGR
jgi:hypothetical protein